MAKSNEKMMKDAVRAEYVAKISEAILAMGEDVQFSKSNEFAFPVCDAEGGERWVKVVISVPDGARDEDGYDGYGLAEMYQEKLVKDAEKAKAKEAERAAKLAKKANK